MTTISAEFSGVAELMRLKKLSDNQVFVQLLPQLLYCEVSSPLQLFYTASSPAGSSDSTVTRLNKMSFKMEFLTFKCLETPDSRHNFILTYKEGEKKEPELHHKFYRKPQQEIIKNFLHGLHTWRRQIVLGRC